MRSRRRAFLVLIAGSIASCSKDYGSDEASDGGPDASDELASPPPPPPLPDDAGVDADASRCPDAPGPTLVEVDTYCIDATEVTVAQYDAFRLEVGLDAGPQPS